jgi:hypothetical protein
LLRPPSVFRFIAAALVMAASIAVGGPPPPAAAQAEIRPIVFPVQGRVTFVDSFGAPRAGGRSHLGVDLMGPKLLPLLAAVDGTVTWLRHDARAGNNLVITDAEGWTYHYVHINNDSPGTNDNANPREWAFVGGLKQGDRVRAGQPIAYLGDSGNAEGGPPHLHFEIHRPDKVVINPTPSTRSALDGGSPPPTRPAPLGALWLADARGQVFALGNGVHRGDAATMALNQPVVGMASTPTGRGYWLLAQDGGVFSYGDAAFFGSTGAMRLNRPVIGMAPTPGGKGYWLVASDGGIFSFGDARFAGSTGGIRLAQPINGMAGTPSGRGYWLVAADGGIFAFGDATFHGSAAPNRLGAPTVGIAPLPDGSGYWIAASNGRVSAYGRATHRGDLAGRNLAAPIARIQANPDGNGYWLIATDGTLHPFGSATPLTVASPAAGIIATSAR